VRAVKTTLALVLAAALLAGCGGDDGNGNGNNSDSEATPRQEFVASANQICRERVTAIQNLERQLGSPNAPTKQVLARFGRILPQIADEFRGMSDQLGELSPPGAVQEQYELTLSRIDRVADELDKAAAEAKAGDREGFNEELRQSPAALAIQRFFRNNKIDDCA
jgi:hypothetical protein